MRLVTALVAALLAGPALAQGELPPAPLVPLAEGTVLVEGGLDAAGRRVLALEPAGPGSCWVVRAFAGGGGTWRPGPRVAGGPTMPEACVHVSAAAAADGGTAAVFAYRADRATVLDAAGGSLGVAAEIALDGEKSFAIPAPGGVALAPDGSALVLGLTNYDCKIGLPYTRCGTARLWLRAAGQWREGKAFPLPEGGPFTLLYGTSVAVARGGALVAAGGPSHVGHQGEVYLFERRGEGWTEVGVLVPDGRQESGFGTALAVAADGRMTVVGSGEAVYVFDRDLRGWGLAAKLEAPEASAGYFGAAVALSGDGRRLLVGAPRSRCGELPRCGAVYLYERGGTARDWSLVRRIDPAVPRPMVDFGWRVALDGNGRAAALQGERVWIATLP